MSVNLERVRELVWRKIGDDVMVVSPNSSKMITLNSTASLIWEKCDGVTDARVIAEIIEQRFTVSFEEAYKDVLAVMERLERIGLLRPVGNQ
jgi:hypothetical protein